MWPQGREGCRPGLGFFLGAVSVLPTPVPLAPPHSQAWGPGGRGPLCLPRESGPWDLTQPDLGVRAHGGSSNGAPSSHEALYDRAVGRAPQSTTALGSLSDPQGQGSERDQEAGAPGQTLGWGPVSSLPSWVAHTASSSSEPWPTTLTPHGFLVRYWVRLGQGMAFALNPSQCPEGQSESAMASPCPSASTSGAHRPGGRSVGTCRATASHTAGHAGAHQCVHVTERASEVHRHPTSPPSASPDRAVLH